MKDMDLRIGNCYNSIKFNTPIKLHLEDFAEASVHADGSDSLEWFDTHIESIPLTEQWLKDLGFEKRGRNIYLILIDESGINQISLRYKKLVTNKSGIVNIDHIKYVHQLQNLYFALTGKELTK